MLVCFNSEWAREKLYSMRTSLAKLRIIGAVNKLSTVPSSFPALGTTVTSWSQPGVSANSSREESSICSGKKIQVI